MTLATMADNAMPLAERVNAAYLVGIQVADGDENGQDARAALDGLRTDVAAADRLARAANIYADEEDEYWRSGGEPFELEQLANEEHVAALDAYRARMQGVDRGECSTLCHPAESRCMVDGSNRCSASGRTMPLERAASVAATAAASEGVGR